jgi:hypothetical protein
VEVIGMSYRRNLLKPNPIRFTMLVPSDIRLSQIDWTAPADCERKQLLREQAMPEMGNQAENGTQHRGLQLVRILGNGSASNRSCLRVSAIAAPSL